MSGQWTSRTRVTPGGLMVGRWTEAMAQDKSPGSLKRAAASRPHRLVRNLAALYCGLTLLIALLLSAAFWPIEGFARMRALANETIVHGMGVIVLSTLFLTATVFVAAMLVTGSRRQLLLIDEGEAEPDWLPQSLSRWTDVSLPVAARQGQGIVLFIGTLLTCGVTWLLWPLHYPPGTIESDANLLSGFAFALSFISLVCERIVKEFPAAQLPEAPSLRRLLLLATLLFLAAGCFQVAHGVGLAWIRWPTIVVAFVPWLISAELALRAGARQFLPDPEADEATAVTESIIVTLITGGPRAPAMLIRSHLGLDFARSWAVAYLRSAALPATFATAILCWGLTGTKLIEFGQRGVYERFGEPVSVVGPGLHFLLPWPLGKLRTVEFGTNHMIAVGAEQPLAAVEQIKAEDNPPAALNHLWAAANPAEATYLVASQSADQQGFQAVTAEIRVQYRIGMTDAQALQSVYAVADSATLVTEAANRLVGQYFASHTLDSVLGERRETLAESLRSKLADDFAVRNGGVEVVGVLIEAIHPPAGAAAAYHAVQAAEINASASVSNEKGRAVRSAGTAQQEARQALDAAEATAYETTQSAGADAYRFEAERKADGLNPDAFLLERSYRNLTAALQQRRLTIMDARLPADQGPVIDMRGAGPATTAKAAPAPANPAPAQRRPGIIELPTPGSSTESPAPPLTAEEGASKRSKNEPPE
jgi:regulator of protease activity HflC (stomatin/prohibitin superfamily)